MELHRLLNGEIVGITEEEYNAIHASDTTWNKDAHCLEVEKAVDDLVDDVLKALWYHSLGDVAATAVNTKARWNEEAILVNEWQAQCYELLEDYKLSVTEQTAQPIETFINSLPKFDN